MALKFLDSVGLAHVFDKIKALLAEKSDTNHTHNYAGSASVGGAATSANKLNTDAGSATQPVYFANGVPVKTTHTLGASVPSGAKFTDTTYTAMTASEATTGTGTTARSITAKVLNDKINEVVDANAYTHPSYTAKSSGLYKVTVDATGHVSATAAVAKSDITGLGIPAQDTTYSAATASAAGLMSAADKSKLDGIASGANAYTLPTASSTLGGVKTTSNVTSTSGLTACPIIGGVPYYKDTDTTATLSGLGISATATELNYVDGVTSNIQTQLNGKLSTSGTAAKATADASGNNIVNTYATKTELATALTTDEIDAILV